MIEIVKEQQSLKYYRDMADVISTAQEEGSNEARLHSLKLHESGLPDREINRRIAC